MVNPVIDFASGDFQTFLDNELAFLQTQLDPSDFNDFGASNIMMFLVRLNAYTSGIQTYKLDAAANENFPTTATQRRSIIRFAKALGYQLALPTASSVNLQVQVATSDVVPIYIRKGTQFQAGGRTFEIDNTYILTAGTTNQWVIQGQTTPNALIGAIEGQTFTETWDSDGTLNQSHVLSRSPVINNTVSVTVDSVAWTKFDYIVFANPTDNAFVLSFDENNVGTVTFGNGHYGVVPPLGVSVSATYRIGGGIAGDLSAGSITTVITAYRNNITPLNFTVTNPTAASGGADAETVEHAKLFIPKFLKTINHAVTAQDYTTLASVFSDPAVGTVAKANTVLRGGELNKVDVFIWTRDPSTSALVGGTNVPIALINALKTYLQERNVLVHDLSVFAGQVQPINITADVLYKASTTSTNVLTNLQTTAEAFFNDANFNPGTTVRLSKLYDAFQTTDGVDSLIITVPSTNVSVTGDKIAVLGTPTFNVTPAPITP